MEGLISLYLELQIIVKKLGDIKKKVAKEPIAVYGDTYTYSDYLKFDFEEAVELIRGKLFRMSPAPKSIHQEISSNFQGVIWSYLKLKPCKVYPAPFDVILPIQNEKKQTSTTVVQPDICVICDLSKIEESGCVGEPDLIIEILSSSTAKKDLNDKYSIYEEVGVKEYWIVMPLEQIVQSFHLVNEKYQLKRAYNSEDIITSEMFPGLEINLREVFGINRAV